MSTHEEILSRPTSYSDCAHMIDEYGRASLIAVRLLETTRSKMKKKNDTTPQCLCTHDEQRRGKNAQFRFIESDKNAHNGCRIVHRKKISCLDCACVHPLVISHLK